MTRTSPGTVEAWQWLGESLKEGDPDWVAECSEPTWSPICLTGFTGGMTVWTCRGKQSAKPRDWIVRLDGEVYIFTEAAWKILRAGAAQDAPDRLPTHGGLLTEINRAAHSAGTNAWVRDVLKRAHRAIRDLAPAVSSTHAREGQS